MTVAEVKTLPLAQKIQILEAIWEDLRGRLDPAEPPQRVKDLLDERRARAREGSAKVLDWDTVKSSLGRP